MLCLFRSFILFPAYAGVIPYKVKDVWYLCPFPRTRGGDPYQYKAAVAETGFSPHTRG